MNVTMSAPKKARASAPHHRRERRALKRRAYFADRVLRGKLTSRQRRKIERAPLADLHRLKLAEEKARQEAAEAAELDRLAALQAAKDNLAGIVPVEGGVDAASSL